MPVCKHVFIPALPSLQREGVGFEPHFFGLNCSDTEFIQ
jgi:hypothetical protein